MERMIPRDNVTSLLVFIVLLSTPEFTTAGGIDTDALG
jgi:hypothetical protein